MEKRSRPPHHRETITQSPEHGEVHAPLEFDTRELLGSRQEATIIHAGERYRLRVTANNKLILTK
jgi:hemin uptake protein HemP